MVGVVSGNGLGLLSGSGATLGGATAVGERKVATNGDNVFVNAATGNLILQRQDDFLSSAHSDGIAITRTYNSLGQLGDDNGDNWQLTLSKKLVLSGTVSPSTMASLVVTRIDGDASAARYRYAGLSPDGARHQYLNDDGAGSVDKLFYNAQTATWSWEDGGSDQFETYDATGRITGARDQSYAYKPNGLLASVTDASGGGAFFTYGGASGLNLMSVELKYAQAGQNGGPSVLQSSKRVSYTYDASNRLHEVITDLTPDDGSIGDANVFWTRYSYDGASKRVALIEQKDGAQLRITYHAGSGKVDTISDGKYETQEFDFDRAALTIVTDQDGKRTAFGYDVNGQLEAIVAIPLSGRTESTTFAYDARGNVVEQTDADGNVTVRRYDEYNNCVYERNGAGNVTTREFDAKLHEKLVGETTYASAGFNLDGTEFLQGPSLTRYVYDLSGEKLRFVVDPDGGATEYRYDGYRLAKTLRYPDLRVALNATQNQTLTASINAALLSTTDISVSTLTALLNSTSLATTDVSTTVTNATLSANLLKTTDTQTVIYTLPLDATKLSPTQQPTQYDLPLDFSKVVSSETQSQTVGGMLKKGVLSTKRTQITPTTAALNTAALVPPTSGGSYQIVSGDTWAVITQKLYGTSSPDAAQKLLTTLDGGTLTPGDQLGYLPASLTYPVTTTVTVPAHYKVAVGDTWEDIALVLYGTNDAGVAQILKSKVGSPVLAPGTEITGIPANVTYTRTVMAPVPPYYYVKSGDTWASLTASFYGRADAAGVALLQSAVGNPGLAVGVKLAGLPATLSYSVSAQNPAPPYYTVKQGDSWSSITLALYGTADPAVVADLKYRMGNPALTTGSLLYGFPQYLAHSVTTTIPVPPYYAIPSGSTWSTVCLALYGTNNAAAIAALQAIVGKGLNTRGGGQLTNLPTTLTFSVTLTVNVPPYYKVVQGDTWSGIAGTVYGAASAEAGMALQQALGAPLLTAGAVLKSFPSSLSYTTSATITVAPYYMVSSGDTWSTISTKLYGTPDAATFLAAAMGGVTLSAGVKLNNLPQTATYTTGIGTDQAAVLLNQLETQVAPRQADAMLTQRWYDVRGQLAKSTTFASIAANGNGIFDGKESTTFFTHDHTGLLTHSIDANNNQVSFAYDGMGRQIELVQKAHLGVATATSSVTDDVSRMRFVDNAYVWTTQTVVTYADAHRLITTYDASGRLLLSRVTDSSGAIKADTLYRYDSAGRLNVVEAPDGSKTYAFYNAAGQKAFTVDGDGSAVEFKYSPAGQLLKTTRLASFVDVGSVTINAGKALAALRAEDFTYLNDPALDRSEWRAYDGAGRLARTVDAEGFAVDYRYDSQSRMTQRIAYANAITQGSGDLASMAAATASVDDRYESFAYSGDGTLRYKDDADSTVTMVSDAAGQLQSAYTANASVRTTYFYDAKGLLEGEIDKEGYLTEFVRDGNGNVLRKIRYAEKPVPRTPTDSVSKFRPANPLFEKQVTSYEYIQDRLVKEIGPDGTATVYAYDVMGRLMSTTAAFNTSDARTSLIKRDGLGRVTAELSAEGAALIQPGQTAAQLAAIWDQYAVKYTYDQAGLRTSMTDQNGKQFVYYYDADGRLAVSISSDGDVTRRVYNAFNELTEVTQFATHLSANMRALMPGGVLSSAIRSIIEANSDPVHDVVNAYSYNRLGQIDVERKGGGSIDRLYNAFGEVREETQHISATEARTSSMVYDTKGRLLTRLTDLRDSPALEETFKYDSEGLLWWRSVGGTVSTIGYNDLNQITSTGTALGQAAMRDYDAFGRLLFEASELGYKTVYRYDTAQRSMTVTTPEGVVTTIVTNRHGQRQSVKIGQDTTVYDYDLNGALRSVSDALGVVSSTDYDRAGRAEVVRDANGVETRYSYDAVGRVLSSTVDPAGLNLKTSYTYDGAGHVLTVVDPAGVVEVSTYDQFGNLKTRTVDSTGLALTTSFDYDARGLVTKITDAAGIVTMLTYDELGRRLTETVDSEGYALTNKFSYDAAGNVRTREDANQHVTTFYFDSNNRMTGKVDATGAATTFVYNDANELIQTTTYATKLDPSLLPVVLTPDDLVSIMSLITTDPARDLVVKTVYNEDGKVRFTVDATGAVSETEYDVQGRVSKTTDYAQRIGLAASYTESTVAAAVATLAADPSNESTRIGYDVRGRVSDKFNGKGGLVHYEYDSGNRVARVIGYGAVGGPALTRELMQYDAAGRLSATAVAQTVDAAGNATAWSITRNSYDVAGNMTHRTAFAQSLTSTPPPATASRAAVDQWIASVAVTPAHDVQDRYIYDSAHRQVGHATAQQETSGVLQWAITTQELDSVGNVKVRVRHADLRTFAGINSSTPQSAVAQWILASTGSDERNDTTRFEYDGARRLFRMIDSSGTVTTTSADGVGNVIEISTRWVQDGVRNERLESFAYDAANRRTYSSKDALERDYDGTGSLVSTRLENRLVRYAYDAGGQLRYEIDGEGYIKEYVRDGLGRVLTSIEYSEQFKFDNGQQTATVAEVDDSIGPLDQKSRVSSVQYDALGNVITRTDALNLSEHYEFDGLGRKTAFVNKLNHRWTYENDANGRVTTERSPVVEFYKSDGSVSVQSIVDKVEYDALGNVRNRTEAAGTDKARTTTYAYDLRGRQVKTTIPAVNVYDGARDPRSITDVDRTETLAPIAASTTVVYDAFGNAIRNIDALGNVTRRMYSPRGDLLMEVDALGFATQYERDPFGNATKLTRFAESVLDAAVNTSVTQIYLALLGRAPEIAAFGFWGPQLTQGQSFEGLADAVAASPEGQSGYNAGASTDGFIAFIFENITGRRPDANEIGKFSSLAGGMTRGAIVKLVIEGLTETQDIKSWNTRLEALIPSRSDTLKQIAFYYMAIFARPPTTADFGEALSALQGGKSVGQLIAMLLESHAGSAACPVDTHDFIKYLAVSVIGEPLGYSDSNFLSAMADNISRAKALETMFHLLADMSAFDQMAPLMPAAIEPYLLLAPTTTIATERFDLAAATVALLRADSSRSRTVEMTYGQRDELLTSLESEATYHQELSAWEPYMWTFKSRRLTTNTYDAHGQLTEQLVMGGRAGSEGAEQMTVSSSTVYGYNARGDMVTQSVKGRDRWIKSQYVEEWIEHANETLPVEGSYLTSMEYDAFGNMIAKTEYARAIASERGELQSDSGDRVTKYSYDNLNRKVQEFATVGVDRVGDAQPVSADELVTTSWDYDDVGNQTEVKDHLGGITRSHYDALGRIFAVTTSAGVDQAELGSLQLASQNAAGIDLTTFKRDVHGYVLEATTHDSGAVSHLAPVAAAANGKERSTKTEYDLNGNAIKHTNAELETTYASFDLLGRLVKHWQSVKQQNLGKDEAVSHNTVYTINQYDAAGRLIEVVTPGSSQVVTSPNTIADMPAGTVNLKRQTTVFNAFGEATARLLNGVRYEYSDYDNAGNVWRTNAGDGVDRIQFHTIISGQIGLRLQSATTDKGVEGDLSKYKSLDEVDSRSLAFHGVETRYDVMGRVTETTTIVSNEQDNVRPKKAEMVGTGIAEIRINSGAIKWVSSGNGDAHWDNPNRISVDFEMPTDLGNGDILVEFGYTTIGSNTTYEEFPGEPLPVPDGGTHVVRQVISMNSLSLDSLGRWSASLEWPNLPPVDPTKIDKVAIFKRDIKGAWKLLSTVDAPPANQSIAVQQKTGGPFLQVPPNSPVSWSPPSGLGAAAEFAFGDATLIDLAGANPGKYQVDVGGGEVIQLSIYAGVDTNNHAVITGRYFSGWFMDATRQTVHQRSDRWGNVVAVSNLRDEKLETQYVYNDRNQLIEQKLVRAANDDAVDQVGTTLSSTRTYFDALGREVGTRDAKLNVTRQFYDGNGDLAYVRDAAGNLERSTFNQFGEKLTLTRSFDAERDLTVRYDYDKLGRVLSSSMDNVETDTVTDTTGGNGMLIALPAHLSTLTQSFTYDELGRRFTSQNSDGGKTITRYDLAGNVVGTRDEAGIVMKYAYDAAHRKTFELDLAGKAMTWEYDAASGLLQKHRDLGGIEVRYHYDGMNRLVWKESDERGGGLGKQDITYAYNKFGQLSTIKDVTLNQLTSYTYDEAGNRIREKTALIRTMEIKDGGDFPQTPDAKQIAALYITLLGRAPELRGLLFWMASLPKLGNDVGDIATAMLTSPEAQHSLPPSLSNSQFITKAYTLAVGRPPTYSELIASVNRLSAGATRGDEIAGILANAFVGAEKIAFEAKVLAALQPKVLDNVRNDVIGQDNHITYDEHNRVKTIADSRYLVNYEYDLNGNREVVDTTYADDGGVVINTVAVNTYDAMNRQLIVNGERAAGSDVVELGRFGHRITYDGLGNRKTDEYKIVVKKDNKDQVIAVTDQFTYDNAGRLKWTIRADAGKDWIIDMRKYDQAGRLAQSGGATYMYDRNGTYLSQEDYKAVLSQWGISTSYRTFIYDAAGKILRHKERDVTGTAGTDVKYQLDPTHDYASRVGYDEAGHLKGYFVVPPNNKDNEVLYTTEYAYFDTYSQSAVTARGTKTTGVTKSEYDVNGFLIKVSEAAIGDQKERLRTFVNNAAGQVLQATADAKVMHALVVNGEMLGSTGGSDGDITPGIFGSTYQTPSAVSASAPFVYVVQAAGETLQSIAKSVWGDSKLWYLIADANGLGMESLQQGMALQMPARVNTVHNDYGTFKPYDASPLVGETTPTLPWVESKQGCGTFGTIIMVAVAIVVTIYTAGVAAQAIGAYLAAAGSGASVLGGMAAVNIGAGAFATGLSVTTGATVAGAVGTYSLGVTMAAAAIGGAVGSIASQGIGIAMGNQQKFSWSAVGMSALGSGITAGLGHTSVFGSGASTFFHGTERMAVASRAALASALTQGIGSATKVQEGFSWRNVAAAGVASAVAKTIQGPVGSLVAWAGSAKDLAGSVLTSALASTTAKRLTGGKVEYKQIFADAFGNALGESMVDSIKARERENYLAADQMRAGREDAAAYNDAWRGGAESELIPALSGLRSAADEIIQLGDGRVKLPSGRIVRPSVHAANVSPMDIGNGAASESANGVGAQGSEPRVLYMGKEGPVYAGDVSVPFYGLERRTNYRVPNMPNWMRPTQGEATMSYDSVGQPFYSINGELVPPVLAYKTPSLSELQTDALGASMWKTVSKVAGGAYDFARTGVGMYFGDDASWTRGISASNKLSDGVSQLTMQSLLSGIATGSYEISGVGLLGAASADRYDLVGSRGVGVVLGLGTGAATHGAANILGDVLGGTGVYGKVPVFTQRDALAATGFKNDIKLEIHFDKHGYEVRANTIDEYLDFGRDVLNSGREFDYFYEPAQEMRRGYASFLRSDAKTGEALFGFVGTDRNGYVTTIHTKPRGELFKLLEDPAQSKFNAWRNSNIGEQPQYGWKFPYNKSEYDLMIAKGKSGN